MNPQQSRVAVVSGAAGSVGAACAGLLARRGYRLALHYSKSAESAEQVARHCQALGADAFEYDDRRLTLDLNLEVELKRRLQLYVAAQNVFNARAVTLRYGSATPPYGKVYLTGANGVGPVNPTGRSIKS